MYVTVGKCRIEGITGEKSGNVNATNEFRFFGISDSTNRMIGGDSQRIIEFTRAPTINENEKSNTVQRSPFIVRNYDRLAKKDPAHILLTNDFRIAQITKRVRFESYQARCTAKYRDLCDLI